MLSVLANRTCRHLFAAQVIALIVTGMMTVALGLLAFKIAGDKAGAVLGTALAIKMIAYVGIAQWSADLPTIFHVAHFWFRWILRALPSLWCCRSSIRFGRYIC